MITNTFGVVKTFGAITLTIFRDHGLNWIDVDIGGLGSGKPVTKLNSSELWCWSVKILACRNGTGRR